MSPFGIAERKQVGVQGYDSRGGVVERYALAASSMKATSGSR
jgi:hypothetical protein